MKPNYTKGMCFLSFLFIFGIQVFSQTNTVTNDSVHSQTISVTLLDEIEKEPIPFANIVAYNLAGVQLTVGTTNMDGVANLIVQELNEYIIKGVYIGYEAEIDTIFGILPGSNYTHTLTLKEGERESYLTLCCFSYCYSVESEEEFYEAEREFERMTEEVDILVDINDFICFPNPAKDILNIKINGEKVKELRVMDVNGSAVIQEDVNTENHQFEFNLNQLSQGIYYVVTYGEGHASSTKTIIKN